MKTRRLLILTAILAIAAACATTPETPEQVLARQAFYNVRPDTYGRLQANTSDPLCEFSQALVQNGRPMFARREESLADTTIRSEQLQGHFRRLVGSTMHNGWISGGAVVAIIERTDTSVTFWRVVTEVPYSDVTSAATEYCQTRGLSSRPAGQSFACSPVYQPIRGQIIQGQDLDMRMQQTYAISAFTCS